MNEAAFLDAIREAPEDDLTRLAFADWLDENGQADRAEFIRVQIDLDRLPPASPRVPELRVREGELLLAHEPDWVGDGWAGRLVHWEFRRGLLHAVKIQPGPFVREGEGLFARHPLQRVALVNAEGQSLEEADIRAVCAAPAMRHVQSLEVSGCVSGEPMCGMYGGEVPTNTWLQGLSDARHVAGLRRLSLVGHTRSGRDGLEMDAWRRFCRAPHLRSLERLDLSSGYDPESPEEMPGLMAELARATFALRLRSLDLAGLAVTDEAAAVLARAEGLSGLEELNLAGCEHLREDGMRAVLGGLSKLRSLGSPFGPRLAFLAASPALGRLRELCLWGSASGWELGIGDRRYQMGRQVWRDEWEPFFRSDNLANLENFTLNVGTVVPEEAVAALLSATWVKGLKELNLHFDGTTAAAYSPLFGHPTEGPTTLSRLSLRPTEGLGAMLAAWPGLAGLVQLSLVDLWWGADEAPLASAYLTPRLVRLDLTGACKSPDNALKLAGAPGLRGLRWLGFGYNQLTPDTAAALARSPNLRCLESLHLGSENSDDGRDVRAALAALTSLGRLRDVVVGSETEEGALDDLIARFGPRLRVWSDC